MERKKRMEKIWQRGFKNSFDFLKRTDKFISCCKTERECVKEAVRLAKERGYRDLQDVIAKNETLSAGDKYMRLIRKKPLYYTTSEKNR